ncbi:MAG: MFS transporter [Flammeovirgaceae bacterium]
MKSAENSAYKNQFNNYLGGLASWWVGLGLQSVLIPYVVTQELHETPEKLGIAQMCTMLPAFLLILHAGITADRTDSRNIALRLHLFSFFPSFAIGMLVFLHRLHFSGVILYALAMGVLSAYNIPSRDALLHRVVIGKIQQEVSRATTIQFLSQVSGFLLAASASFVPIEDLFFAQALIMIAGAVFMRGIEPKPKHEVKQNQQTPILQSLKEGFAIVGNHAPMRLVSLLNILVGLIFMGGLMVAVPIIVRDVYHGNSTTLSFAITSFYVGVVAASIILSKMRRIHNIGLILVTVMALGSGAMLIITFSVPYSVFIFLIFGWGMAVGFVFTLGRAVIQESAPKGMQARALSIYQIGITGGAPIGSITLGFLTHELGALEVLYIPALLLLVILLIACGSTDLLHITIGKQPPYHDKVPVEQD